VHTTQANDLGSVRKFSDGNSYIYLKGVTSCADGSMVVFQPGVWTAVLLASGLKGSVAIATAAVDAATKFGWFTYIGQDVGISASAVASAAPLYGGATTGAVGDTATKGNQIVNCYSRNAAGAAAGSVIIQLDRSFIGMNNESVG